MNEQYTSFSTTSNVVQAVIDTLKGLDPENVTVPSDTTVVMQDVQAAIARQFKQGGC